MKILLLIPIEPKRSREAIADNATEHLGIGYIFSVLKNNNYSVDLINIGFEKLEIADLCTRIKNYGYSLIGITVAYQKLIPTVIELVKQLRDNQISQHIVLGGHPVAFWYKELLAQEYKIDTICIGEGEHTIIDLADAIKNKKSFVEIKGIAYRNETEIVLNEYRESVKNLDEIPFPERINVEVMINKTHQQHFINIAGSRGCTWSCCSFCDIQEFYKKCPGEKWRSRSVKNIMDEIEFVINKYNYNKFNFVDDDFFGPKEIKEERVNEFCKEIENRKINLKFRITCKVKDIEENILIKLKKAGLERVFIGIESGVQRTLNTLGKGVSVNENRDAILRVQNLDLQCECGSIFIDPYTTIDELKESIMFWENFGLMSIEIFNKLEIFRGTTIYKKLQASNMLKESYFGFDYLPYMDKKVAKVFEIVEFLRDHFITHRFIQLKKVKRRIHSIVENNSEYGDEMVYVVDDLRELKASLTYKLFNEILKNLVNDIDKIEEIDITSYLDKYFIDYTDKFNRVIEKLSKY